MQQILAGREAHVVDSWENQPCFCLKVNAVCNVAGRRGRTVSAIQFQAHLTESWKGWECTSGQSVPDERGVQVDVGPGT